jgi:hypothetical protein
MRPRPRDLLALVAFALLVLTASPALGSSD